jgi:hypothetical protein
MRPVSFGDLYEAIGRDRTFFRMRPAGQRLETRQPPRPQLEDRLISELQLPLRNGVAQLTFEP